MYVDNGLDDRITKKKTPTGSILKGGLITSSNQPASHIDGQGEKSGDNFLCIYPSDKGIQEKKGRKEVLKENSFSQSSRCEISGG